MEDAARRGGRLRRELEARGAEGPRDGSGLEGLVDFLVVEDDERLARAMAGVLARHGVVRCVHTAAAALERLDGGALPLGMLVDEALPDGRGTAFLLGARERGWRGVALVATGQGGLEVQQEAFRAGASFRSKPLDAGELEVFAGRCHEPPNRLARAADLLARLASLTDRERAVLDHSLFGTPRADLAERLGVSSHAVKATVARLLAKLHQRSGSLQSAMSLAHLVARCPTARDVARCSPLLERIAGS